MKMAMKDGMIRIIEADVTQAAIIKSWGKMKYSRSNQMYEGPVSMELLNKLAGLVRLPPAIEAVRKNMNKVQEAVDQERVRKDPKPLVDYPVTKSLYQHQVRAANMALLTFGLIPPEKEDYEDVDHKN
jgi:hypothetical protein